jgi:hypothetical protein
MSMPSRMSVARAVTSDSDRLQQHKFGMHEHQHSTTMDQQRNNSACGCASAWEAAADKLGRPAPDLLLAAQQDSSRVLTRLNPRCQGALKFRHATGHCTSLAAAQSCQQASSSSPEQASKVCGRCCDVHMGITQACRHKQVNHKISGCCSQPT